MNRQLTLITDEGTRSTGRSTRVRPSRAEARRRREIAARRRAVEAARETAQRARQAAAEREESLLLEHNRAVFAQLAARRGHSTIPGPVPRKRTKGPSNHNSSGNTPHAA